MAKSDRELNILLTKLIEGVALGELTVDDVDNVIKTLDTDETNRLLAMMQDLERKSNKKLN